MPEEYSDPSEGGKETSIDLSGFDSIPEHKGGMRALLEQANGNPVDCPFIRSMGAAGIELVQNLAAAEESQERGLTLREILEAKRAATHAAGTVHEPSGLEPILKSEKVKTDETKVDKPTIVLASETIDQIPETIAPSQVFHSHELMPGRVVKSHDLNTFVESEVPIAQKARSTDSHELISAPIELKLSTEQTNNSPFNQELLPEVPAFPSNEENLHTSNLGTESEREQHMPRIPISPINEVATPQPIPDISVEKTAFATMPRAFQETTIALSQDEQHEHADPDGVTLGLNEVSMAGETAVPAIDTQETPRDILVEDSGLDETSVQDNLGDFIAPSEEGAETGAFPTLDLIGVTSESEIIGVSGDEAESSTGPEVLTTGAHEREPISSAPRSITAYIAEQFVTVEATSTLGPLAQKAISILKEISIASPSQEESAKNGDHEMLETVLIEMLDEVGVYSSREIVKIFLQNILDRTADLTFDELDSLDLTNLIDLGTHEMKSQDSHSFMGKVTQLFKPVRIGKYILQLQTAA